MNNSRIFTKEDKALRPRVYIQKENVNETEDNLFFQIESEKEEDGKVYSSGNLQYTKDGKSKNLQIRTDAENINVKDGSLAQKIDFLEDKIISSTLYYSNWEIGTNDIPYIQRLEYNISTKCDVYIALDTEDKSIIDQCAKANIIAGNHYTNYIEIFAYGIKPTVNIPIKLIVTPREQDNEEPYILEPASETKLGGIIPGEGFEVSDDGSLNASTISSLLNELNETVS